MELQRNKSQEVQLRQKQIQVSQSSKTEIFKPPQLLQLQNSNAILHGSRAESLHSVTQSLTSEVESYIRPPACVFDTPLSIPNSSSINSFSSNVISGFSKSDFADFLQPSLPPQAAISITNNATKFVINNFHPRPTLMCGANRKRDDLKIADCSPPVPGGSKSDPLTQAVSVSGLASSGTTVPAKRPVPKAIAEANASPKAKAHPGLFM
jgi:hypothetical protein